ncbi:11851_t:CDS:1, partial [Racocetra fulgida]
RPEKTTIDLKLKVINLSRVTSIPSLTTVVKVIRPNTIAIVITKLSITINQTIYELYKREFTFKILRC